MYSYMSHKFYFCRFINIESSKREDVVNSGYISDGTDYGNVTHVYENPPIIMDYKPVFSSPSTNTKPELVPNDATDANNVNDQTVTSDATDATDKNDETDKNDVANTNDPTAINDATDTTDAETDLNATILAIEEDVAPSSSIWEGIMGFVEDIDRDSKTVDVSVNK